MIARIMIVAYHWSHTHYLEDVPQDPILFRSLSDKVSRRHVKIGGETFTGAPFKDGEPDSFVRIFT